MIDFFETELDELSGWDLFPIKSTEPPAATAQDSFRATPGVLRRGGLPMGPRGSTPDENPLFLNQVGHRGRAGRCRR